MLTVERCFGLNMLTTLPLEAFVCREVMTNYYFPNEPFHPQRHLVFSTSLVVSAMMLSLLTCDLGAVFELIGATSACALAYILPPLCFVKLRTKRDSQTWLAWGVIVFGAAVFIISLVLAIIQMINSMPSLPRTTHGKHANEQSRRRRGDHLRLSIGRAV